MPGPKNISSTACACSARSASRLIPKHGCGIAKSSDTIAAQSLIPGGRLKPGTYFTGDGARKDKDGYFWVMGRVDDVINVSGHRLSTMEVESALVAHEAVAEAAVVARPDDIKGQAISAFVTLEQGRKPTPELKDELRKWVAKEIGAMAKPDDIRFTDTLPKTRSGKIMRRLLRELASSGEVKGDTTTLEDFGIIAKLKEQDEV